MKLYSQTNEQDIILNYFGDRIGNFLDAGCNDGVSFSNTYALALQGWSGCLIDASPKAFEKLQKTYKDNPNMELFNVAISDEEGEATFYESGSHIGNEDVGLLSSLSKTEIARWKSSGEIFEEVKVKTTTINKVISQTPFDTFQMISLDVEGNELICLQQLDLIKLKTELIVVEYNSNNQRAAEIKEFCNAAGLNRRLLINAENVIWAK